MNDVHACEGQGFGLVLIGDWVLATGRDALAASLVTMLGHGARLRFIEAVPADPAAIADALARAQKRPFTVIVAGGLGTGVDDWTWSVIQAQSRGRAQMLGLGDTAPMPRPESGHAIQHMNLILLPGSPERALQAFRHWLDRQRVLESSAPATAETARVERVLLPWTLPESEQQRQARQQLFEAQPDILQGIVRGKNPKELALELSARSRSKLDKALRFLRAQMRTPRTNSPTKAGPR